MNHNVTDRNKSDPEKKMLPRDMIEIGFSGRYLFSGHIYNEI